MRNKRKKDFVVKKERLISLTVDIRFIIKLIFITLILIAIWYIIQFRHLDVYLTDSSKYSHYLFTILVSVLMLMILVSIGLFFGNLGRSYKIAIILIIFYFAYLGYEYIGIGINFRSNFHLLNEPVFETNTRKGMDFFTENILLLFVLFMISFPFEHEKK